MSGNENKRELAQKLFRSMTEIDDRYLAEAMEPDMTEADVQVQMTEGPEKKTRPIRFRGLSRWALTAAACLTVVLVGRYVVIRQNTELTGEKAITSVVESETSGSEDKKNAVQDVEIVEENAVQDAGIADEAPALQAEEADMADEAPALQAEEAEVADEAPALQPEEAELADEASALQLGEADMAEEPGGEDAAEAPDREDAAAGGLAAMDAGAAYESAQIANPWTDTETLEEAESIAGVEIRIPEAVEPYTTLVYRAMEGEMLEIIFTDEDGEEGFRIRKAPGDEDISGDYNTYSAEKTITLKDGTEVTMRGEKQGSWSVAVWTVSPGEREDGGEAYSCSISAGEKQFTTAEIREMAEQMRE